MTWALVATGFLGSLHCVGMCGGFVLGLDRPDRHAWRRAAVQALFHLGKTTTYVLLGGLVGAFGAGLVRSGWFGAAQSVLSVVAGCFLILAGLQVGGWLRSWPVGSLFGPSSLYGRTFQAAMNVRGWVAPWMTGALTGFLPCPLVYGFLAAALATGTVLESMGVMAILGLTSMPALVLVVLGGARLGPAGRKRMVQVAGVLIVIFGVVTLLRGVGLDLLHGLFGGGAHHGHHPGGGA